MNGERRSEVSPQSSGELQPVKWSPRQRGGARPTSKNGSSAAGPSRNAIKSIQLASATAQSFDANYAVRNAERERSVPLFHGTEVVLESVEPFRMHGCYAEYGLMGLSLSVDDRQQQQQQQQHGHRAEETRQRYADRIQHSNEHYSVKYLQKGIIDTGLGPSAAREMILEAKILMNLASHPNILQIYGVNQNGIDSFLESNFRKSFFLITDRVRETLVDRLNSWRENRSYNSGQRIYDDLAEDQSHLMERLEIANDICSALIFLHNRKLVMNIRPDKVGFDNKLGRVKIISFGQSRQDGMDDHASSITKSDDVANTLAYTAPEVLCNAPATVSADVYGFGIMLWEILSLKRPFVGYNRAQHYEKVVQNNHRPTITKESEAMWPKEICQLIPKCWDPHMRLTMKAVGETLETAILFHEPEPSSAAAAAAAGCHMNDEKGMQTSKSKSGRKAVQRTRSHAVPLELTKGSETPPHQRRRPSIRGSSRGRRKSPGRGGVKERRRGSRSPSRRRVSASRSLDSLINSSDDPAALREVLWKLGVNPVNGAVELDAKSNQTPPTDVSNYSNTSSAPSPAKGPTKRNVPRRRSHSVIRSCPSPSPVTSPTKQKPLRRRSHSVIRHASGDALPSSPRRPFAQGEERTKSPCNHLEKTQKARSGGVKRANSDFGPKSASLVSPGAGAFCLDNLVAAPRRSRSTPSLGPLFKDLPPPPAPSVDGDDQLSLIPGVSKPKGGRKVLEKASSARDVRRKDKREHKEDSRPQRAKSPASFSDDVIARFSQSFPSLSSDFHQEGKSELNKDSQSSSANRFDNSFSSFAACDFQQKDNHTKVIRVKVKKSRNETQGW